MNSKLRLNYIDTAQELYDLWSKLTDKEKNIEHAEWVKEKVTNGHYIVELGQYGIEDSYLIPDYLSSEGADGCWEDIYKEWSKRHSG